MRAIRARTGSKMSSSDGKGRRHDVMEMEIKFKGKTEQLTIHFGDDPYAVALVRAVEVDLH